MPKRNEIGMTRGESCDTMCLDVCLATRSARNRVRRAACRAPATRRLRPPPARIYAISATSSQLTAARASHVVPSHTHSSAARSRRRRRLEMDVSHETALSVIEDVAMEHPHPRTLVEDDQKPNCAVDRHVDRVLPGHRTKRLELLVERQEEKAVKMERVCEPALVLHYPDLFLTEPCRKRLGLPERPTVHLEL